MPNFWNKTAQFFDEAFNGPRTKDVEFDLLTKEILVIENGVMALKQILENFLDYSLNFKKLFYDISLSIPKIYNNTSPFYSLGKGISDSHIQMEKLFDSYSTNVIRLIKKTTEWSALFTQAKSQIEKREENRKIYDHYDEKLEKIFKNKKKDKGKRRSMKDEEFHNRNLEKYKKATEDYIKSSDESYAIISEVMNKRYEMINPVLLEFISEERKFFLNIVNIITSLEDIEIKFQNVKKTIPDEQVSDYDPCIYIRGGLLIKKENIKKNKPNELTKSITTEEVFEKSVSQCKIETKLLKGNSKDEEEEVYIAKKQSLKPDSTKRKSFLCIPDQFSKKNENNDINNKEDLNKSNNDSLDKELFPDNFNNRKSCFSMKNKRTHISSNNAEKDLFSDLY